LKHLDPVRNWAEFKPFHKHFQALWAEYFRSLDKLRNAGGLGSVESRSAGPGGGWIARSLRTQDLDPILLSLIKSPSPPIPDTSTDPWAELTIPKVVEFLSSLGIAPTARQLHLLLQYFTLDSIFHLDSPLPYQVAIRQARRDGARRAVNFVERALKVWAKRRRLGSRVEALIRGLRPQEGAEDGFERWMELPMVTEEDDPGHVKHLRLTLSEMTMACLEEAIRLKDMLEEEGEEMISEGPDLEREVRYWMSRRDRMIKDLRAELMTDRGLMRRWEKSMEEPGEDEAVYPTEREEYILQLLLRDSLLRSIRSPSPNLTESLRGVPKLDDTFNLFQLLLGQPRKSNLIKSHIIGGTIIRLRNAFYHERRFLSLLAVIDFIAPPSSCPPLSGQILASLLLAARNPQQFAHLLTSLIRLPPPISPAVIDASTRRMLLRFALDASATRLDHLITPNPNPQAQVEGEGFTDLLHRTYDKWGVGLPKNMRMEKRGVDQLKRKKESSHRLKEVAPGTLSQNRKGRHLELLEGRDKGQWGKIR